MSESLKHECGIALVRLRKPLSYYKEKYGTWNYGIEKLYLLMEKQHNRGQDGAGVASVKLHPQPGSVYMDHTRSNSPTPLRDVFDTISAGWDGFRRHPAATGQWITAHIPFTGEVLLGHLRYQTQGDRTIDFVHPVLRSNNWRSRSLTVAGNFTLTNAGEVFQQLVEIGQYPHNTSDTVSLLERMGHLLDRQNETLYGQYREKYPALPRKKIATCIEDHLDIPFLLKETIRKLDGGYVIGGIVGQGDAFVVRDPHGIRPAFYYADEEVVVVASERPVIQTAFRVRTDSVEELPAGAALILKKDGSLALEQIIPALERKACSFERIYFSRGTDKYIYRERKKLGGQLTGKVLDAIGYDFDHTIFSYIPNTAETAFYGLVKGVEDYMLQDKHRRILQADVLSPGELWNIIAPRLRIEKIAVKDAKMRTFITEGASRNNMVEHVYDVTYGIVRRHIDSIVIIDDSIVRGTTLKQSILKMLDRLEPKKIIVVSSAPQIRYPDCYGIEMSRMKEFCAFLAAVELLKERGMASLVEDVYQRCKQQEKKSGGWVNHVKDIYRPFTPEEISRKIVALLRPENMRAEVELVFQSLEGLHAACPDNTGDWYFSGDYPTPGGVRVVNNAYIRYFEEENKQLKLI
ncbi:MAG: amidophosphoribosyltransferase [Prevotellaceae bacterium]|jgi:amidophosphoribosyltransferase|nr:amidophosphoribosyltransferase [Prevotellaceae bacterium]